MDVRSNNKRIRLDKPLHIQDTNNKRKHKDKQVNEIKKNIEIRNNENKDIYLYGFPFKNRIQGFTFSFPLQDNEIKEIKNLITPFWYPTKNNTLLFNNTNMFNAYIKSITDDYYVLSNDIKIKKEEISIKLLKNLKRNENVLIKNYENILNGNELKMNILYPFKRNKENGLIEIYQFEDLCIGSKIMGKVKNNFIKTLTGKFNCVHLRNHINKTIIEAECYKIINDELYFKEIFKTQKGEEIINTFKIEKKISENKFLCVSKKVKGIYFLKEGDKKKVGDIIKCTVNITELGVFLKLIEEENNLMAIDFNESILKEDFIENVPITENYITTITKEADHMKINERLIYLINLIESEETNERNTLLICIIYLKNIKKTFMQETLKKTVNKIIVLLKKAEKSDLIKEFLKMIYKSNLFEESLINIFMQHNIKKPIILFYFSHNRINNIIEILEKEPKLIIHFYETYPEKIMEIRNINELLIKKLSTENNLLYILYKTYVSCEIKLNNITYVTNLYERMFEIKFKKNNAKQLCDSYIKFMQNFNEKDEIDISASLKCEEYVNKHFK